MIRKPSKYAARPVSYRNRLLGRIGIGCLLAVYVLGCARDVPPPKKPAHYPKPYRVFGKWYQPIPDATGFRQDGIASWYGADFHGRKTSNGEIYNMYAMTAAHKTLPLGTHVRVRNLSNHREIEVRINDRGPFVRGRVIDLSYTAAKKIGIVGPGTAPVEVVALGVAAPAGKQEGSPQAFAPIDVYTGKFTIQVGAFSLKENADRLKQRLEQKHENVQVIPFDKEGVTFYRIRVGKFTDLKKAEATETALVNGGFSDAFVIAE
jgi:rare lipoprotein A